MSMERYLAALAWPVCTLNATVTLNPRPINRSGGMTMGGGEQIVSAGAGYWVGSMTFIVAKAHRLALWRDIHARLRGRSGTLRVPAYLSEHPSWTTAAELASGNFRLGRRSNVLTTHSDDATFSDGSSYLGSRYEVRLVVAAAAQDERITISVRAGDVPLPGLLLSRWGQLHRVGLVSATGTANVYEVDIWPPLRSAWAAGVRLEADRPTCLMRLTDDEAGQASPRDMSVSISLREAV